jgi:hypothetical protein
MFCKARARMRRENVSLHPPLQGRVAAWGGGAGPRGGAGSRGALRALSPPPAALRAATSPLQEEVIEPRVTAAVL